MADQIDGKIYLVDDGGVIIPASLKAVKLIGTAQGYRTAERRLTWLKLCPAKERYLVISGALVIIPGVHTAALKFREAKTLMRGDALDLDGMAFEFVRQ